MINVAFIPVRGGSKSIPFKNIKEINGKPLVYWTVKAACECNYIDEVYVATDSEKIKETVDSFKTTEEIFLKVQIIGRSEESATDTASTEFAMLEFASNYDFDNIVLIQATSPLLQASDLNKGFEAFSREDTDSVLSVVRQKRFNWQVDESGLAKAINYDIFNRPRRQDYEGYCVENGAFYITSKERLVKFKNRISGNIRAIEMLEDTFFEIDEPSDWVIIESLMKKNDIENHKAVTMGDVKMFLTDCDGCLTDAGMYYSENGDELKKFNTRDGMGFSILREHGIVTGIITSEDVELNRRRAEKLKLDVLENGCKDKYAKIRELCFLHNVDIKNVVYIGDDLNDIEALKHVGFSFCPADANDKVKAVCRYITKSKGGEGVIREVVDLMFDNYIK